MVFGSPPGKCQDSLNSTMTTSFPIFSNSSFTFYLMLYSLKY
jgi:hypothetical protein